MTAEEMKKEFEERFCFSYMENGEKLINEFMWKTSDNTINVWQWFESKLKSEIAEAKIEEIERLQAYLAKDASNIIHPSTLFLRKQELNAPLNKVK